MQTDETFLQKFMRKTSQNYVAPSLKGVSRRKGEKLQGFLQPKFNACVASAVLNWPKKRVAEELDMSHDVLRKWCTEETFLEKMEEIQQDFISAIIKHLKRRTLKQFELTQAFLTLHDDALGSSTPPPLLSHQEFRDIKSYHKVVIVAVMDKIDDLQIKLNTSKGSDLRHWMKGVLDRLRMTELLISSVPRIWLTDSPVIRFG